jgi:GT2 family glycosyltransferase
MNNVTCIVKAFNRPNKFDKCLKYLVDAGLDNILVGFDGDNKQYKLHKRISKKYGNSVKLIRYDYDTGLSEVRNKLLELVDSEYGFLLDDDTYIHPKMLHSIKYLEQEDDISLVAFPCRFIDDRKGVEKWNNYAWDIRIVDNDIKGLIPNLSIKKIDDVYYAKNVDVVSNCFIFKTKAIKEIGGWDNNCRIQTDHIDFYLNMKNSKWSPSFCMNVFAVHKSGPGIFGDGARFTGNLHNKSVEYFKNKWNVKRTQALGLDLYVEKPELFKDKNMYILEEEL